MNLRNCRGVVLLPLLFSCYAPQWNQSAGHELAPPSSITKIFDSYANGVMLLDAASPGADYCYDVGEKDAYYGGEEGFRYTHVELVLHESMPAEKVIVDFTFIDRKGGSVVINNVDLMRLIPKLDGEGELIYPEMLLEEFNRFGVNFRGEHGEFHIAGNDPDQFGAKAYRANITNNCLDATKWEFALTSEDYSDMHDRYKSGINLNQNKILSHSWFYVDSELYAALLKLKNSGKEIPMDLDYDVLSDKAEQVVIDFESLRNPIKRNVEVQTLEIGHQSERKVLPLDVEEHYKREYGLLLNQQDYTYKSILEQPIQTTQFQDQGFYTELAPKEFDFGWMQYVDDIQLDVIDIKGSDAYVQLTLSGEWSPYDITIGNVDLALLDEQKLYGLLFGINTYPKSRRYNPVQNTLSYDAELLPDEIKPFVLLSDKKSGKWVNNQYKGIEKIYLTYEDIEMDVLNVYVLSYERITPVWMGRVKLPKDMRETIRIRKSLYSY